SYPDKITVSDAELASVQIDRDPFHPEWNYTINPRT
ncbi:MAG: ISAzo13-like element transposase-related protein, partial [Solirubrobacteraceae bacterium]